MRRTLVLGLGNPILGDDGVGVRVAESVRAALPAGTRVDVREVSLGGLRLMEAMLGYDRVILVDAVQSRSGRPGTVHRLTVDEVAAITPTRHASSPHDVNLVTALEVARRMGLSLPEEIVIYAVEVANTTDFGLELTPAVAEAIPGVTKAIVQEISGGEHGLT